MVQGQPKKQYLKLLSIVWTLLVSAPLTEDQLMWCELRYTVNVNAIIKMIILVDSNGLYLRYLHEKFVQHFYH